MSRYEIDERGGCIAIVDTDEYQGPGLHADSTGVVWHRSGREIRWWQMALGLANKWATWYVPMRDRRAAKRKLRALEETDE